MFSRIRNKTNSLGLVWTYLSKYKYTFIFLNILSPVYSALVGVSFYYIKKLLDEGFLVHNTNEIGNILLLLFLIFLAQTVIDFIQGYFQLKTLNSISIELKDRLFTSLIAQYSRVNSKQQIGEILSRFNIDVSNLITIIDVFSMAMIKQILSVISILVVLFYLNVKFTLIILVAYPLFILPLIKTGQYVRKLSRQYMQDYGKISNVLYEAFYGYLILITYNLVPHFREKYKSGNQRMAQNTLKGSMVSKVIGPLNDLASFAGLALVLYFSITLIKTGNLSVGSLVAFLAALLKIYQPAKNIFMLHNSIQTSMPGYQRLNSMIGSKAEPTEHSSVLTAEFGHSIKFTNVSFAYGESKPVLNNVSIEINKGEKVAIIGKSGSGKSTLITLLLGLADPQSGIITLDGTDYQKLEKQSLRSQFAYITQEPIIFNDSILYNIQIGDLKCPKEEVIEASKKAQIHSFIMSIHDGYSAIVGDRGTALSGGEKQRITIARALLRNAPIIIFDEATSNLDHETESDLKKEVYNLSKDKTLIIISHRVSTYDGVDKIYRIIDGRIENKGI